MHRKKIWCRRLFSLYAYVADACDAESQGYHCLGTRAQLSNPSSSISFLTSLITSVSPTSAPGFLTFSAITSSTRPLSLATKTPILAQPLSLSHPSTSRPLPRVSSSIGPENIRSVYALKASSQTVSPNIIPKVQKHTEIAAVNLRVKSRTKTLEVAMMVKYDMYAAFPENP